MLTLHFSPFPMLTTERLVLRKITIEDAEAIFVLRSDDRVNKYIDRPRAHNVDDARNFINQIRGRVSQNELLYWAITQKKNNSLIGTIMFWNINREEHTAEVGFELLPDFQGQGMMREALAKVIDFGFNKFGLQVMEALPEEENEKSIALLERAQFQKDDSHQPIADDGDTAIATVRYTLHNN